MLLVYTLPYLTFNAIFYLNTVDMNVKCARYFISENQLSMVMSSPVTYYWMRMVMHVWGMLDWLLRSLRDTHTLQTLKPMWEHLHSETHTLFQERELGDHVMMYSALV